MSNLPKPASHFEPEKNVDDKGNVTGSAPPVSKDTPTQQAFVSLPNQEEPTQQTLVTTELPTKPDYNDLLLKASDERLLLVKEAKPQTLRFYASPTGLTASGFSIVTSPTSSYEQHAIDIFPYNCPVDKIVPAFTLEQIKITNDVLSSAQQSYLSRIPHDTSLVKLNEIEVVTGGSRDLFSLGTGYVMVVPNAEFFEGANLKFVYGVPMADIIFSKLTSQSAADYAFLDRSRIASGFIMFALHFALRTNVNLVVAKDNSARFASELSYSRPMSFVQGKKIVLPVQPHVCFAEGNSLMRYLDTALEGKYTQGVTYKYGRERIITETKEGGPITEITYLNIDNVTAQALGITAHVIGIDRYREDNVKRALLAYSLSGSTVDLMQSDESERMFGRMLSPQQELSYLLVGAALSQDVYKTILRANLDAFMMFGTVMPSLSDSLAKIPADAGNQQIISLIREQQSVSGFENAMEYLAMQVTPPLIWPCVISREVNVTGLSLLIMLLEYILFFIFYPSLAKKCGAGLCNNFYKLVFALSNSEWSQFVTRVGYDGTLGNSIPITDEDYWSNARRPALFTTDLSQFRLLGLIQRLIAPIGEHREHVKAQAAEFPRLKARTEYWNPYPNPGAQHVEQTIFKARLLQAFDETLTLVKDLNQTGQLVSKTLMAGVAKVFNTCKIKLRYHGVGFGRDIGMPLAYLRDRKINFYHDYDGRLDTPFPNQMMLVSASQSPHDHKIPIELRRKGQIVLETGVVWTLVLGLQFPSHQFDEDMTNDPICKFRAPSPGEELGKDDTIIAMCANACVPFSIAAGIISESYADGGMKEIKELLSGSLSSTEFRNLISCIQTAMQGSGFNVGRNRDVFRQNETVDLRFIDPKVRYVENELTIIAPTPQDPPIIRGDLQLIPEGLMSRFRLGLTAIADSSSEYSRLRKGLYLARCEVDVEAPNNALPLDLRDYVEVEYSHDLFQVRRIQTKQALGIFYQGEFYYRPALVPKMLIVVNTSEEMEPSYQEFFMQCLEERRIVIKLPKMYFLSRIVCTHSIQRPDERDAVLGLLAVRNDQIPLVTFYDTEQVDPTIQFDGLASGSKSKFIWPISSIDQNVVVRALGASGSTAPIGFAAPTDSMCDSGSIDDVGNLTTGAGVLKDPRVISLTNGVINYTERANLTGRVLYRYRPAYALDSY
uniref:Major core capsid protein n=1 Tax=Rice ragged stunt virus TaxID=42475 RepID=F4YTT8_RRSV|nr:major core capsid protein [Rice ragged stunt virus]